MKAFVFSLFLLAAAGVSAQTQLPAVENLDEGWNTLATDGVCSTGTPYQFYVKTSDASNDLLVFFNGGGACWFGQACDLSSEPNMHSPFAEMDANNPALGGGVFDLENNENPFRNYNMVMVPYCTGDVHVGAGARDYTYTDAAGQEKQLTANHTGYANSTEILNWVYENFSAPDNVVVSGSSAGAIGSSFYAGSIAEHYSDKPVTLLADAAGGYGSPYLFRTFQAWNTAAILPNWAEYSGKTNDNLTFEDFYIASAQHSPNLTIAQYNAANDITQVMFTHAIGDAPGSFSLPQRILNHYQEIESAVDEFYSYTAGGEVHTIMRSDIFYDYAVEGVRFVDWVSDLINGLPVRDISCVNEVAGCELPPSATN